MYLKKLELLGFKSFADRTEFVFQPGITAIVGPNGCGKSNVVDAFKWIFGEQSAKGLRGSEMRDVIFNGTQSRKPMGFAQVSVTFDNSDGYLPTEYSEVEITRRLFRSGESEYLINKQRCRLKDIKELFLDTGIGRTSYSILEQGKIDVLLQANMQDRRIIFEEAAGISKYRVKKAEALRALVRVEENLSRLQDIIDEVEKRVHRLRVQAGKARKYREYGERLKELRIRLALAEFEGSAAAQASLRNELRDATARLEKLQGIEERLKAHRGRLGARREELASELRRLGGSLEALRIERNGIRERCEQARMRLLELAREIERKEREREETRKLIEELAAGVERETSALALLERANRTARGRLDAAEGDLSRLRAARERAAQCTEQAKAELLDVIERRSRLGNRLIQIEGETANLDSRRKRLKVALERIASELHEARGEEEKRASRVKVLEGEELERAKERAVLSQRAGELKGRMEGVAKEREELTERLRDRRSRYEVLRSLEEELDGVGSAVAEVLRGREALPAGMRPRGLVASLLHVEREHAPAVEAALGDRAQALVVESQDGALQLIEYVKERALGALEVAALDRLSTPEPEFLPRQGGVLGFLREYVRAEPGFEEVADALLADVVLVEDFATALALSRNGLRPFRLVTRDGVLIEPWGSIALPGEGALGLVSRRSEMESLLEECALLESQAAGVGSRLALMKEDLERILEIERSLEDRINEIRREKARVEAEREQCRREVERLARESAVTESELAEIDAERVEREVERKAAERELRLADEERLRLERTVEAAGLALQELERDLQHFEEAVNAARLGLARAEAEKEALAKSLAGRRGLLEERKRRLCEIAEEIEACAGRRREAEETLAASGERLEAIESELRVLEGRYAGIEAQSSEIARLESTFERELERVRSRLRGVAETRESLQLREQEERLRRNAVLERLEEEYGIDLRRLIELREGREAERRETQGPAGGAASGTAASGSSAGESAPGCAGTREGVAARIPEDESLLRYLEPLPDADREAARKEARELQEKIRRLGNVNLEALEELEESEERLRFQLEQKKDLEESERELRNIIGEINRKSREMFLETFSRVQENFNELFRKCFGGGKAELVLEEGQDVLEAGIEIVARPPGKKLTSLSLMSGGEKTMTTIALLLALFRSRPSPFCVLDEVDAALDDTNVRRFLVLVEDFVKDTQFIIITHNKLTMAAAGVLYGVTMQERGVSRKVAVELETYDPEALEREFART